MFIKISSFIVILMLYSCSNVEPNSAPNPLYGKEGRYGNFVQDTIYAQADSVIRGKFLNTSLTAKLSLGEFDGLKAGFEITYNIFKDTALVVDSVYLKFSTANSFGPNANETVSAMMYQIIDSIDTDSINIQDIWRNPTEGAFLSEINAVQFNLADSAQTSVKLPNEIFEKWNVNNDENYGLYFSPLEEDVVLEINSRNSFIAPILVYYTHINDSVVIDTINTGRDATIFNYDELNGQALNFATNQIIVSSGIGSRALLKFDFSSLPENAIIFSADMVLTDDDTNPYENPDNSTSFLLKSVEEVAADEDDFVYNPTRTFSLRSDDGLTSILGTHKSDFATSVIQEIKNGALSNKWFTLEFINSVESLSVKRFLGAQADKTQSPKVIIKYLNAQN
jgi:hypothetical protein